MRFNKKVLLLGVVTAALVTACQENSVDPVNQGEEIKVQPEVYTAYDYERGENYEQTAMVLLQMVQEKPELVRNITKLVKEDKTNSAKIHFADLLEPEKSGLANYRAFNLQSFSTAFNEIFSNAEYPGAKDFSTGNVRTSSAALEEFLKKEGAAIYMPYVEDLDENELPTITFASVGNSGNRVKGYRLTETKAGARTNGYTLEEVMVDDDYSAEHQTWVVQPDDQQMYLIEPIRIDDPIYGGDGGGYTGGGSGDGGSTDCTDPDKLEVLQVKVGYLKVTDQYDPYIGLYNSGESEIVFFRGDVAYDPNNDETEGVPFTQLISVSRSDIRNERWIARNQVWDPNWTEKETQQVFGIYEWDDTDSEVKISGEAKKKVGLKVDGVTVEKEVSAKMEFTYSSKHTVIMNQDWMYQMYKSGNKTADGHGLKDGWRVYASDDVYFTKPYSMSCIDN
jgi:hypothetical protein